MTEMRIYHPENWKPLERWLPTSTCRADFVWMWHEGGLECYRYRGSGELLYLDPIGQCFEVTEVGPMLADFSHHFERCTGQPYPPGAKDSDDEEEESGPNSAVYPPNDNSLSRLINEWAADESIEGIKRDALLSQLKVFKILLLAELEDQCKKCWKTTLCWLA